MQFTPPAVLCPPLKILLPAWIADRLSSALPLPKAGLGNACEPAKGLFLHAQFLAVCGNALYLSIQTELVELVHQIRQRDFVVGRQILSQLQRDVLRDPSLSMDIDIPAHAGNDRRLFLRQPLAVPEPAESVRYVLDFLVPAVLALKHLSIQNPSGCAQRKAEDI